MALKHDKKTLRLTKQRSQAPARWRPALLIAAILIWLGLWGMSRAVCAASVLWLLPGLCTLCLSILFSWEKRWQRVTLLVLCAAGLIARVLCGKLLGQGFAGVANEIRALLTKKTGYYYPPYASADCNDLTLCLLALVSGGLTGCFVRALRGTLHFLCTLGVFALLVAGILEPDLWLGLYLSGTLVLLVRCAAGDGRAMAAAALLTALLMGPFSLASGAAHLDGRGRWLSGLLHKAVYESAENPLPEGELQSLGAFTPSDAPALEVTMEQWTPLYIRGYVGGGYTGQSWEETDPAIFAREAELLYALQSSYFYPAAQMGAAAAATQKQAENSFRLQVLGACTANTYIPYGADNLQLDPRALQSEGGNGGEMLAGSLYDVSQSYLLQARLAVGEGAQSYTDAEAAYREWVYQQYLTVPEDTYAVLAAQFSLPTEAMTSAQARTQVCAWVAATLTYDKSAAVSQGSMDFAEYLLTINPRGYSVQYATLTTLLLRCCGIPARYVEGYLVPAGAAEDGATLILTQKNAHAWTEIYLDGVGWIPVDATPENAVVYALPPDGSVSGGSQMPQTNAQTQQEPQKIQIQQEGKHQTGAVSAEHFLWGLLSLVLLAILGLLLRMLLLRRRLKKRISAFRSGEPKVACLACLCYTRTVLTHLGLEARNVPLTRRSGEIAALLEAEKADVEEILNMIAELCFSDHTVTEQHRVRVLEAMNAVCTVWKKKTGLFRRIFARWITCKIL